MNYLLVSRKKYDEGGQRDTSGGPGKKEGDVIRLSPRTPEYRADSPQVSTGGLSAAQKGEKKNRIPAASAFVRTIPGGYWAGKSKSPEEKKRGWGWGPLWGEGASRMSLGKKKKKEIKRLWRRGGSNLGSEGLAKQKKKD